MCSILMAAKMLFHESQNVISPLESSLSFPDVKLSLQGECRDCRYGGAFKLPRVRNRRGLHHVLWFSASAMTLVASGARRASVAYEVPSRIFHEFWFGPCGGGPSGASSKNHFVKE